MLHPLLLERNNYVWDTISKHCQNENSGKDVS